jgi:hypothetical protein
MLIEVVAVYFEAYLGGTEDHEKPQPGCQFSDQNMKSNLQNAKQEC